NRMHVATHCLAGKHQPFQLLLTLSHNTWLILLPDAPRRAANIREKGEVYRQQHFPRTGALLLQLAQVVETGEDDKREGVFNQIAPTYRDEYSGGDSEFLA